MLVLPLRILCKCSWTVGKVAVIAKPPHLMLAVSCSRWLGHLHWVPPHSLGFLTAWLDSHSKCSKRQEVGEALSLGPEPID